MRKLKRVCPRFLQGSDYRYTNRTMGRGGGKGGGGGASKSASSKGKSTSSTLDDSAGSSNTLDHSAGLANVPRDDALQDALRNAMADVGAEDSLQLRAHFEALADGELKASIVRFFHQSASYIGSDVRLTTGELTRPDAWPRRTVEPGWWKVGFGGLRVRNPEAIPHILT